MCPRLFGFLWRRHCWHQDGKQALWANPPRCKWHRLAFNGDYEKWVCCLCGKVDWVKITYDDGFPP